MPDTSRPLTCRLMGLCLALLLGSGCAQFPRNEPMHAIDMGSGYRVSQTTGDTDDSMELVIVLTFSGGGTRAAALAYGVLEVLAESVVEFDGRSRRLVDEIDIVSAVSGGSVTAAYFGLHGTGIFDDFETRFLRRNVQGALTRRFLAPWNWPRLLSPYFGRGDIAAEYFDKNLFDGATFADIGRRDGPAILINATDISNGTRMSFSQESFDLFCSDLTNYPVARAVAASSAVPVLLSPISLVNYPSEQCGYQRPEWVDERLSSTASGDRRRQEALRIAHYTKPDDIQYVHLVDGGLSDNLGLRVTIERAATTGGYVELVNASGLTRFRRILHLVVNAQTNPGQHWSKSARPPGFVETVIAAPGVSLSRYNFETVETFLSHRERWMEDLRRYRCEHPEAGFSPEDCADLKSYFVEVSFDHHPDPAERAYLAALPTSFALKDEQVDRARQAARDVLAASPAFQALLQDLDTLSPRQENQAQ